MKPAPPGDQELDPREELHELSRSIRSHLDAQLNGAKLADDFLQQSQEI